MTTVPIKLSEAQVSEPVIKKLVDTNPSNYTIQPKGDGIIARSSKTGEVFEGSIKNFSKALK